MNISFSTGAMPFRVKVIALAITAISSNAHAFQIETGNPDLKVRWDNTVKYSAGYRLKNQSSELSSTAFGPAGIVGPNNINQDDGDNNFDKGLISNRLDVFSELDASYGNVGARISAAAWYDDVYHRRTDNNSGTGNHVPANEFSDDAKETMGGDVEILDAFVYGRFPFQDGTGSVRLGRYSMLWGESLFFGMNGIAGGQAPTDLVKLLSVPSSQFKEVVMPTGKLSVALPLSENVSFSAYAGYEWEKTRLVPAGGYLSSSDVLEGEYLNAGGLGMFNRGGDLSASDTGQYGVQLRWTAPAIDTDFGLYAIRFHSTSPSNIYTSLAVSDAGLVADEYRWAYHEGVKAYGASFAKSIGVWGLAGEVSYRQNTPLASSGQTVIPSLGIQYDNDNHPGYAVGETAHIQFSWMASLGPSFIAREASFLGEVAWNTRVKVTKNKEMLNPNADRSAAAIRMSYQPVYRQLLSGIDVTPSVGMGYTMGKSSALGSGFGVDKGGDINLGVSAVYLNAWTATLNYVKYIGPEGSTLDNNSDSQYKQALKDRDFISLSLRTTF